MKITKDCNIFKSPTINLDNKTLKSNDVLKFRKSPSVIHKIMIIKKIKGGEYEFKNVYPIFNDTVVLKDTEIL